MKDGASKRGHVFTKQIKKATCGGIIISPPCAVLHLMYSMLQQAGLVFVVEQNTIYDNIYILYITSMSWRAVCFVYLCKACLCVICMCDLLESEMLHLKGLP